MSVLSAGRRGRYGVDAPWALGGLAFGAVLALTFAGTAAASGHLGPGFWVPLVLGLYFAASTLSYAYTTRLGKFVVWAEELDRLGLAGDEHALDLGCGRGMVLIQAARRLPRGKVTGIDLWRSVDQSGNNAETTERNAAAEGVADRVELATGDMSELPYDDGGFDLILSSLAIHNIGNADGRKRAVSEAYRVLKPGGRLLIADYRHASEYAAILRRLGAAEVAVRPLGWRFWYGAPWFGTSLLTAHKPG